MNQNRSGLNTRDLALIGLFAALMAICSWISIPASVPFTLQTFGVFIAVGLLGGKRGTLTILVYLLLGCIGLPVFANFTGGVGILLGNTGGYLFGFLFSAALMWIMEKLPLPETPRLGLSMTAGLLVCYLIGTLWFYRVYTAANGAVSIGMILSWCVLPYIPFDAAKIALALILTNRLKKRIPA
ncbi:MAG: biotin transporter BioY [Clostridia bacterium]|nr:biotin transporter BioY [Clostridia bacterium]